jgi:hypothetical protein
MFYSSAIYILSVIYVVKVVICFLFWLSKFKSSVLFQSLINALHNEVGDDNVKLGTEVLSLACTLDGAPAPGGWSISDDSKDASGKDLAKNQTFDAVIMTVRTTNLHLSFRVLVSGQ